MSLENSLLKSLFPYTAKRIPVVAEERIDINAEEPVYGQTPAPLPDDINAQLGIATPDRVSIEQGGASTQYPQIEQALSNTNTIGSLNQTPDVSAEYTEFELPYPNPTSMYEQTQNALAKGTYDAQNPVNRDKGFKGALKEALQNFAFGLSHAQPGMGFWESMALGGTGLGAGLVDRSSNERREAMRNLPMLQQNAKIASDEQMRQKQMENMDADNVARDAAAAAKIERDKRDYDLKVKMTDWKIEDQSEYRRLEREKFEALKENRLDLYDLAVRRQIEIERNNKAKIDATNENVDRRINATSGVKGHSPAPPRTSVTPQKTTEAAARAYLSKKLKGEALENAIKTARANGEIQ